MAKLKGKKADAYGLALRVDISSLVNDIKQMAAHLDPATEGFDDMLKRVDGIGRISRTIKGNFNKSTVVGWRNELVQARKEIIRMQSGMSSKVKNIRRATQETEKLAKAAGEVAKRQKEAEAAFRGTTLDAQNFIRVIQDLPYGPMGIANNIEQIADSWGRAKKAGVSFATWMMTTLRTLLGPMSIPLLIATLTAVALSWDKIGGMIDKAKVALGKMTGAQRDFNKAMKELKEGANDYSDLIAEITDASLKQFYINTVQRRAELKLAKQQAEAEYELAEVELARAQARGEANQEHHRAAREAMEDLKRAKAQFEEFDEIMHQALTRIRKDADTIRKEGVLAGLGAIFDRKEKKEKKDKEFDWEAARVRAHKFLVKMNEDIGKEALRIREGFLQQMEDMVLLSMEEGLRREIALENVKWDRLIAAAIVNGERYEGEIENLMRLREQSIDRIIAESSIDRIRRQDGIYDAEIKALQDKLDRELDIEADAIAEKQKLRAQAGQIMLRSLHEFSGAAESLYRTWEQQREEELDSLGYTEEQKNEIIKREGAKRFEQLKAIRYVEAVASTIAAGVEAYRTGVTIGGPLGLAVGGSMMAAALATGYAQAREIQRLRPGRGGGGGSTTASYTTGYTTLTGGIRDDRMQSYAIESSRDRASLSRSGFGQGIASQTNEIVAAIRETKDIHVGNKTAAEIDKAGKRASSKLYS